METLDKSNRRLPYEHHSTGRRLHKLTPARAEILEVIHWLGAASSSNIKELLRLNGVANLKTQVETITHMFHELNNEDGDFYLDRPKYQFPNQKMVVQRRHLHLAHELGLGGINYLKRKDKWRDIVHGGHWEHQLMEATFLWEIYLGVKATPGLTFMPHHQSAPLDTPNIYKVPITWEGQKLITELKPDAHFSIDYHGKKKCHFFYEADRGTEQKSNYIYGKKTIERMIMQYRMFLGAKGDEPLYRKLLKTKDPALVLLHFNNKAKKEAAMEVVRKHSPVGNGFLCFRDDERFIDDTFAPPHFSLQNWNEPWDRVGRPPLYINTLKEKTAP